VDLTELDVAWGVLRVRCLLEAVTWSQWCDGAGVQPPCPVPIKSLLLSSIGTGCRRIPFLLPVSSYASTSDGESRCKVTVLKIAVSITVPACDGGFQLPTRSETADPGSSSENIQTSPHFSKQAL